MSNDHNPKQAQLLDRAIEALRDSSRSGAPSESLIRATAERLEAAEASIKQTLLTPFDFRRFLTMQQVRRMSLAAVVLLAAGAVVVFSVFIETDRSAAFAQVIENVKQVHSVRLIMDTTVDAPMVGKMNMSYELTVMDPGMMRMVLLKGPPGTEGSTTVLDFQKQQVLTLIPSQKMAMRMNIQNMPADQAAQQNILEQFRKLKTENTIPIEGRTIDGREYPGFSCVSSEMPGITARVWYDEDEQLPVYVEQQVRMSAVPASDITMHDFVWDVEVDASQFSLEAPEGYALHDMNFNMSDPDEKTLIEGLRLSAEFNGGEFMEEFSTMGLGKVTQAIQRDAPGAVGSEERKAWEKKIESMMMTSAPEIGRAMGFAGNTKYGSDFQYAGKGVKLGEENRPIFWYKPTGSETYRVIDAKLNVTDVAVDQLPQIESVEVGPTPVGVNTPKVTP